MARWVDSETGHMSEHDLDGRNAIPDDEYRRSVETALERLDVGVVLTSRGRLVYTNDALTRILGYSREALQYVDTITLADPAEQPELRARVEARLRGVDTPMTYEVRVRRGSGEPAYVHIASAVLPDADDHVLTLVRDISRERALARATEQRHRMEAVGQLCAGVAHDFNNYLTAIRLIGEELLHADEDRRAALLAELETATTGASRLTEQLVTFAGTDGPPTAVLDVNVVVFEVASLLRRLIGSPAELALNLEPGLPPAAIDAGQLRQVLINLVVNARQAVAAGGRITIQTSARDGFVDLTVTDDGVGMEPAVLERACEPFFTTRPAKGSGMGLAIVFGIARRCGGQLEIVSTPGAGTSVRLALPQAAASLEAPGPATAQPEPFGDRPARVLLVESDPRIGDLLLSGLTRIGFDVVRGGLDASDGLDAEFDAVVLGIDPHTSPVDRIEAFRDRAPAGRIVLLGATADFKPADADAARTAVVAKPFSVTDVANAIRTGR